MATGTATPQVGSVTRVPSQVHENLLSGEMSEQVRKWQIADDDGISLILTDGFSLSIVAADRRSAAAIEYLRHAMQLESCTAISGPLVVVASEVVPSSSTCSTDKMLVVSRSQGPAEITLALQLIHISLAVCLRTQACGAVLLHGALAQRDGQGVILASPGGIGKTTASRRSSPPWHSLSDDTSLVMCDAEGKYWVHPWPTWSQFVAGGPGGTWDVQHRVRLRGIFFLVRAENDEVKSVGSGHAATLLVESAEQAWWG